MPKAPKQSKKDKDYEDQISQLTESLMRERADAANVRRRAGEDVVNALVRGKEQAVEDLLPLIDTLTLAFSHAPSDIADNKWVSGILGLDKQLSALMKDFGLEKIEVVGQDFDPEIMQAVTVEDAGNGREVVSEELQPGYRLNGKVVRVAMVKVAS